MDREERPWPSVFRGRLYVSEHPSQVTLSVRVSEEATLYAKLKPCKVETHPKSQAHSLR